MTSQKLAALFQEYGDDVYRFAYSLTRHAADAEDICQTVFCRAARGDVEHVPGREKAWLMQCTANACKNRLRFLRYWAPAPLEEAECIPDEADRGVFASVMALPAKYRAPIHLYYYEGYKTAEIARLTGEREGTVRSRLSRARGKLKELLKGELL